MPSPKRERVLWSVPLPPAIDLPQLLPPDRFEIRTITLEDEAGLARLIEDASYVVKAGKLRITRPMLERATELKLIVKANIFWHDIDLAAAAEAGVAVCSLDIGTRQIAEHVLASMLALSRRLFQADRAVREGSYRRLGLAPTAVSQELVADNWVGMTPPRPLAGRRLGVIGLGEIGSHVAKVCRDFGMEVGYFAPTRDPPFERATGIPYHPLDSLLEQADFVTLHGRLLPGRYPVIGRRELALMRPSAYLINTSRGPLVDTAALIEALDRGHIAGAALDAFDKEPLAQDSPLIELDNVILTPHIAGGRDPALGSSREWVRGTERICETIVGVSQGREPRYLISGGDSR